MLTAELSGALLDYYVARAEGVPAEQLTIRRIQRSTEYHVVHRLPYSGVKVLSYSTDWAQGGPLIEKHRMYLEWDEDGYWCCHTYAGGTYQEAAAPLRAICRAVVRAAFGDEVEEVAVC